MVAVGIVAIATSAAIGGAIAAAHTFGPDLRYEALHAALEREAGLATDLLKYRGGTIVPATVATTIPLPGASPEPAHVSIGSSPMPNGAVSVTLAASLDDRPQETATFTTVVPAPAPLPQSTIVVGGNAPQ